jgi:putative membrane protein
VAFLTRVLVNAVALAVATWLLADIRVTEADRGRQVLTLVVVAVVFGLVNSFVRPVVKVLALPFILLTLGLLLFVINALMLLLTSWLAGQLGVGWHVEGFLTALVGALVVTVVTWVVELVLPGDR